MNPPFPFKTAIFFAMLLPLILLLSGCFASHDVKITDSAEKAAITRLASASLECHTLIIGGGIGGVYTAYQLGKQGMRSVCLFELENRLGGRIFDISFDDKETSPRIGAGARRIHSGHSLVALARELGISLDEAPSPSDLMFARGRRSASKDELAKLAYPSLVHLDKTRQNNSEVEDALYEQLQRGTKQKQFPAFPSFVKAITSPEGYHYLLDVSRFRGDFQYPIDTRSYLDWFKEELTYGNARLLYPQGGMGEFVKRMAKAAQKKGVKFFTSQPVKMLRHGSSGYVAITPDYRINAKKVIIAVNAAKLQDIQGDVINTIVNSPQYKQLLGIPAVTITQWWQEPWWEKANKGKPAYRLWSNDHCINLMEIPTDRYGKRQLASRTVYSDEMTCVALWRQLAQVSTQAVENEISHELNNIFPDVNIPKPLKTYVKVWPDAWYWLKAGSSYTNCDIAGWAATPLPREPVYLAGESYNPQRASWSDAAIRSSKAALNAGFGFNLPDAADSPTCKSAIRP